EKLQIEIRLDPVVPLNGELVSNLLNVRRLQTHWDFNPTTMSILRAIPGLFPILPRSLSENRRPHTHERRAFFNRDRVILRHSHREVRKIDMEFRLQAI